MAKYPPSYYETQLKRLNADFSVMLNEMTGSFLMQSLPKYKCNDRSL